MRAWLTGGVLVLILGGCGEPPQSELDPTPSVKYVRVGDDIDLPTRRISGRLVAAETSDLSFGVNGTVETVRVNVGDDFRADDVLAKLDATTFELSVAQARAELDSARAQLNEKDQQVRRLTALREKQAIAAADLDTAEAALSTAQNSVRAAQAQLDLALENLERSVLIAPFDGTVAARDINAYQEVSSTQRAFLVQSEAILEAEVLVPETMIRSVDYGQVVSLQLPAFPDQSISGVVNKIESQAISGNAYPVSVRLGPTSADVRVGMTANVVFTLSSAETEEVHLLPMSVLVLGKGANAPAVYVVNNGVLELRTVEAGEVRGNRIEVFGGLESGELVVSAGVPFLEPGMAVNLWESGSGLPDA